MNRRILSVLLLASLLCALMFILSGCNGMQSLSAWRLPTSTQNKTQPDGNVGRYAGSYDTPSGRPADFQEFKKRYASVGASPEGAVRMYFDALYSYIDPARKTEGAKMLRYSLHQGLHWEKSPVWATFMSRLDQSSYHYIFRSFAKGTSPENNYVMDPDNYQLMVVATRQETDYVYISIRSSGADSPRPLHVQQFEDGLWYVINNHGTYSDIRTPSNQIRRGGHDADMD